MGQAGYTLAVPITRGTLGTIRMMIRGEHSATAPRSWGESEGNLLAFLRRLGYEQTMNRSNRSSCEPSSAHPSLSLVERLRRPQPEQAHFGRTNPNAWSGKRPDTLQRYIHTAVPFL